MTTYVYETVPTDPNVAPRRFEVRQSMLEAPLTKDPETGEPVRRVISGGIGVITSAKPTAKSGPAPAACSPYCACHHGGN